MPAKEHRAAVVGSFWLEEDGEQSPVVVVPDKVWSQLCIPEPGSIGAPLHEPVVCWCPGFLDSSGFFYVHWVKGSSPLPNRALGGRPRIRGAEFGFAANHLPRVGPAKLYFLPPMN